MNARRLSHLVIAAALAAGMPASADDIGAPGSEARAPTEHSTASPVGAARPADALSVPAGRTVAPAEKSAATRTIKPTGSIAVDATVIEAPGIGTVGTVEIRVTAAAPLGDVVVAFGDAVGIDVLAVDGPASAATIDAGDSLVVSANVLAVEPGRYGLPVFVSGRVGQRSVARSLVVPIPVADPSAAAASAAGKADDTAVAAETDKSAAARAGGSASGAGLGRSDSAEPAKSEAVRSMRATETIR